MMKSGDGLDRKTGVLAHLSLGLEASGIAHAIYSYRISRSVSVKETDSRSASQA